MDAEQEGKCFGWKGIDTFTVGKQKDEKKMCGLNEEMDESKERSSGMA